MSRLNGRVQERHNPYDGPLDGLIAAAAVAVPDSPAPVPATPQAVPAPDAPWPEPRIVRDELLPVPPLEPSMLPHALRAWLADVAERVGCPIDYPAVGAIIALAALVGRRVGIRPKRRDDWVVVPNLWGAIVGRPGALKSPALMEATRFLKRLAHDAHERFEERQHAYAADLAVAKARREGLESRLKTAVKSRPDQVDEVRAEIAAWREPEPPVERRYDTNDPTVEKLGELLAANPRGMLVYRDELVGLLRNLDREGHEGDRAFYLEGWNGNSAYTYDRIKRGTIRIEAACVSVLGGIQPGPLGHYLRGAAAGGAGDDGLVSRFQLLVYPTPPLSWTNVDRFPDNAAKDAAFRVFEALDTVDVASLGAEADPHDQEHGIPTLRFDDAAQDLFDEWREDLEHRLRDPNESPLIEAHLSKYRSLMPSLALLFHLADVAGGGADAGPVSYAAAMQAAAWCDYLEAHARRVYAAAGEGDTAAGRALLAKIRAGKVVSPFTVHKVAQKHWSGLATAHDVERAVAVLTDHGWLRERTVETGGRPRVDYHIHPHAAPCRGAE